MNYNGVEAFLSIIKNRSITGASKELKLSQSTVSYRLNTLEKEIGRKLITRYKGINEVTLTDYGEEFISIAQRWISLNKEFDMFRSEQLRSRLLIGGEESFNSFLLKDVYLNTIQENPNLQLDIQNFDSEYLYEAIGNKVLDIAFVKECKHIEGIKTEAIFDESLKLVCPVENQSYSGEVALDELKSGDEIYIKWSSEYELWHKRWFDGKYQIKIDSIPLISSLLRKPDDWAIVPQSITKMYFGDGSFKILDLKNPPPRRVCYKITNIDISSKKKNNLKILDGYLSKLLHKHQELIN